MSPGPSSLPAGLATLLAADLGLRGWSEEAALSLDEAVAYARRGRGPRSRPSAGWASLTPAEQKVVELVVGDQSNAEIAEGLFVSIATVKTHLNHIFAKLGVANRRQLARAARSGDRLGKDLALRARAKLN